MDETTIDRSWKYGGIVASVYLRRIIVVGLDLEGGRRNTRSLERIVRWFVGDTRIEKGGRGRNLILGKKRDLSNKRVQEGKE